MLDKFASINIKPNINNKIYILNIDINNYVLKCINKKYPDTQI